MDHGKAHVLAQANAELFAAATAVGALTDADPSGQLTDELWDSCQRMERALIAVGRLQPRACGSA